LLAAYDVDLVVDVGANSGQYASALRTAGCAGRIAARRRLAARHG
jgi:hypothetical protein